MNTPENYLRNFKLKAPPSDLKKSVVGNAENHWLQMETSAIPAGLMKIIKLVIYSSAASIILMLSLAFFSSPVHTGETDPNSQELNLLMDIGISRQAACLIISLGKSEKCPINPQQIFKEEI